MLRAREPRLLTGDRAQRMLDAASFEEAAKQLTDCGYPDMSQMSAAEIEAELAKRRAAVFREIESLSPQKEAAAIFRMKYDYHNAKTIIKAEAMGLQPDRLLSDSGRVPPQELLSAFVEERGVKLPPVLAAAMWEAKAVLARTANPQLADFVLDKAYFEETAAAAKAVDSRFLINYVKLLIDSANLRSAIRSLRMGRSADFLAAVLIPDGSIDPARIAAAGSGEGIAALYARGPLEKAAALGAEAASGGSMTAFELACDNAANAYLRDAKLVSYGCEVVVAYLAALESEITAVRMILTGRLAGVEPGAIRERLRDLYA